MQHTFHSCVGTELSYVLDVVLSKNSNIPVELYSIPGGSSNHNTVIVDLGDPPDIHPVQDEILLSKIQWDLFRRNFDHKLGPFPRIEAKADIDDAIEKLEEGVTRILEQGLITFPKQPV